jgi:transglutaminase/protease-like cytokinesis protein 3
MYSESENIFQEAIDIHDEVMPLMGDIMQLQSTLKSIKQTMSDEAQIEKINIALQNLENAHNAMMGWMKNITPIPDIPKNSEDISSYPTKKEMLEIQEKSLENIKKVKNAILASIDKANALISEL